jgi:lipopolysaccharide/colanic/teichoic acid biosynthesis glycosyltransferase
MLKRSFDILLSLIGLILLCPFFLLITVLIKLDSKGPVFYRQVRIGKNGIPFKMFKFRTMMETEHWVGPALSPKNDPRVTTLGAILRRAKINEFPQLVNVLLGDMSFVGPRPEVPEFVELYTDEQQKVLSVRPGIVGPSQIHMRNEEELFAEGVDPKEYYINYILPKKLRIDLKYVHNGSLKKDLTCLLQGIRITLTGAITKRHLFENAEQIGLFICDIFLCAFSYCLAYFLRMEGQIPAVEKTILLHTLPYVIITRMVTFTCCGLYGTLIRYISFEELIKITKGATISSALIILVTFLIGERGHPRSVFGIDWFVLICFMGGYRLSFKALMGSLKPKNGDSQNNLLIYGADKMGDIALRYLKMEGNGKVIGFIDDDPKKMRKRFQGLKILGTRYDIEALARLYHIDQILVTMRDIGSEDLKNIESLCEKAGVKCEVFALAN